MYQLSSSERFMNNRLERTEGYMYIYTLSLGSRSPKRIRGFVGIDVSQSREQRPCCNPAPPPFRLYHHQPGSGDDASMSGRFGGSRL